MMNKFIIGSLNVQRLGETNYVLKCNYLCNLIRHYSLDFLALQELDLACEQCAETRNKVVNTLDQRGFTVLYNGRQGESRCCDTAIVYHTYHEHLIIRKWCSADGRQTAVHLQSGNGFIRLNSTYMIPNPDSKLAQSSRILCTSFWGLHSATEKRKCVGTVLGGDFNSHLWDGDHTTVFPDGRTRKGRVFGPLRDFIYRNHLLDIGAALGNLAYTQRQYVSNSGISYSRKDLLLGSKNLRFSDWNITEPDAVLSDHQLVCVSVHVPPSELQPDDDINSSGRWRPRSHFKDGMRLFADNKDDHVTFYSKMESQEDILSVLKSHGVPCDQLTIRPTISQRAWKCSWPNQNHIEDVIPIWQKASTLQKKFALGSCFSRVQDLQQQIQTPSKWSQWTTEKQIHWIHKILAWSLEKITKSRNSYRDSNNRKCVRQQFNSLSPSEVTYITLSRRMHELKQLLKAPLGDRSRLLANIRRQLGPHYVNLNLLDTIEGRKQLLRILQERMSRAKTKATSVRGKEQSISRWRFCELAKSMKRFFKTTLDPSPPAQPALDANGCYDPQRAEEALVETYRTWTPPMDPPVPVVPKDRVLRWADTNSIWIHPAIRHELGATPKFHSEIWDSVLLPITVEDIKQQCRGRNTSPGITRITYRMLLYAAPHILELLSASLTTILQSGSIPDSLKQALLRPIPKKAGVAIETASRPITILESTYKLFSGIVSNRLQEVIERHQPLYQAQYAFLRHKRIQTPIQTKMDAEEIARARGMPLYVLEMDFSKAYDHTRGHMLDAGAHRFGFPQVLQDLLSNMREGAYSHLLLQKEVVSKIRADTLRQGCPLACLSFNMQLDILLSALDRELVGFSYDQQPALKVQAYADDVATFHGSLADVRRALRLFECFCALNQQKINARKTFLRVIHGPRPEEPVLVNGEPISVVQDSTPTRYLGLYLAPNGSLEPTRRHVMSIIERATCVLQGKQISSALRTLVVNRCLAPKLRFMLAKLPLRLLDLEIFTNRLQKLVATDVVSTNSTALYAPFVQGGAGLFHAGVQVSSAYIQNVLEELNPDAIRTQSDLLCNASFEEDSITSQEVQYLHRRRNNEMAYISQRLTLDLMELAKVKLSTSRCPLGIPVSHFTSDSHAPLSSITSAREYLSYLQCTVQDSSEDVLELQEIHDLVSTTDVVNISKGQKGRAIIDKVPSLVRDGWTLLETSSQLKRATQIGGNLIRPYNPPALHVDIGHNGLVQRPSAWKNWHTNPVRLPTRQQLKAGLPFIVAYGWNYTFTQDGLLLHPNFGRLVTADIDRESRPRQLTDEVYIQTFTPIALEGPHPRLYCNVSTGQQHSIKSNLLVAYYRIRDDDVHYDPTTQDLRIDLPHNRFARDSLLLLNESIRRLRAYSWKILLAEHPMSFQPLSTTNTQRTTHALTDDSIDYLIFTDGSSTQWEHYAIDGAGAVVIHQSPIESNWSNFARHFAHTLPPLYQKTVGKNMGSIRSEIAAACLGIFCLCRDCPRMSLGRLYIDNQALCGIIEDPRKWASLCNYDGHYGALLYELLKLGRVHSVKWVRSHQDDFSDPLVLANSAADALADAARRQSAIHGDYIDLPLHPGNLRFTVTPYSRDFRLPKLENLQSSRPIRHLPLPDPSCTFVRLDSRRWQQRITFVSFGGEIQSPVLPQDNIDHMELNYVAIRIRANLLPKPAQEMVDRPDVYGVTPLCAACRQELTEATYHGIWYHLLFKCMNAEVSALSTKWRKKMDNSLPTHLRQKHHPGPMERLTLCTDHQFETVVFKACQCQIITARQHCAALSNQHYYYNRVAPTGHLLSDALGVLDSPITEGTIHWEAHDFLKRKPALAQDWLTGFSTFDGLPDKIQFSPTYYELVEQLFPGMIKDLIITRTEPHLPERISSSQVSFQSSSQSETPLYIGPLWVRPMKVDSLKSLPSPLVSSSRDWTPILGWADQRMWWSEAQLRGIACHHHLSYIPKGVILYLPAENPRTENGPVALRDVRCLWQHLYSNHSGSSRLFLWLAKGREIVDHCRNIPGIRVVDTWRHNFVCPTQEFCSSNSQLLYWTGHSLQEAISVYTTSGINTRAASQIASAFRSFYKALEQILRVRRRAYDNEQNIHYSLLRVLKHLQEWKASSNKTPFCCYTDTEKEQVLEALKANRKRLADTDIALPVRTCVTG